MQRLFVLFIALFCSVTAFAAEPLALRLEIHGRTPLHKQPTDSPGYGLIGASVFIGEPVIVTVTALNTPAGDATEWIRHLEWNVMTEAGRSIAVTTQRDLDSPVETSHFIRLTRPDAAFANFKFGTLPAGRYIVGLQLRDPETGVRSSAERRRLAVYRGDETPFIRSFFLREQARAALAEGTFESYGKARTMLLQAAEANTDPSYYEELADASLPWARPEETAEFYQRSLEIAARNLEKNHGARKNWPAKALQLYERRARKADAFRRIAKDYAATFTEVRVVLAREAGKEMFVIERRGDGKRLRVVAAQ